MVLVSKTMRFLKEKSICWIGNKINISVTVHQCSLENYIKIEGHLLAGGIFQNENRVQNKIIQPFVVEHDYNYIQIRESE